MSIHNLLTVGNKKWANLYINDLDAKEITSTKVETVEFEIDSLTSVADDVMVKDASNNSAWEKRNKVYDWTDDASGPWSHTGDTNFTVARSVTSSGLVAGTYRIDYSIDINNTGATAEARLLNVTDASAIYGNWIILSAGTGQYNSCTGFKIVALTGDKTFAFEHRTLNAGNTVNANNARMSFTKIN